MKPSISAAILAAGLGTRMKSRKAKVLHEAGGAPMIEHVARTAISVARQAPVAVVVGHQAEAVQAALAAHDVLFVRQDEQRGTGHALQICREALGAADGLLLVLYGDCPLLRVETLTRLIETHQASSAAATLIGVELDDPTGYGRLLLDGGGRLEMDGGGRVLAIVEQKAAAPEQLAIRHVNSGIYCFQAGPFWSLVGELKPNPASGEIYLTDIVELMNARGLAVQACLAPDPTEVLGVNQRIELAVADRLLRERKVRQLMLDGVTIVKPETVTVDTRVEVGMDTVIEPFAQILGKTVIGENCRVGACSIVRDSVLDADVHVEAFSIVGSSRLEAGARVGPYARLRMDNHVGAGAHIGNFVELKKTRLGAGSKAMHLAYLGDSSIGENVNIGAGTITCNYDGVKKHQTAIGDGSFVGSNSTLVAPIQIGAGSYVAAGSVITDPVPDDNLALGRARQVLKPGWPSRRRSGGGS